MTPTRKTLKVLIASLPIFLWFSLLIVIQIPRGFEFMSDTPAPWYQGITMWIFIGCAFFFYPVAYLYQLADTQLLAMDETYFAFCFIYAILVSTILWISLKYLLGRSP